MSGGNKVYIKYAHRYYAEFAREAMMDQMELFEGQKDPLLLRWATKESGNQVEFENEEEQAKHEIAQIKESLNKRRKLNYQRDQRAQT